MHVLFATHSLHIWGEINWAQEMSQLAQRADLSLGVQIKHLHFGRNILFSSPIFCVPTHSWSFSDSVSGEEHGAHWCAREVWGWGENAECVVGQSTAPKATCLLLWIPGLCPDLENQNSRGCVLAPVCFQSDCDHCPSLETSSLGQLSLHITHGLDKMLTLTRHSVQCGQTEEVSLGLKDREKAETRRET